MSALDQNTADAINGDGGGYWAPSAEIVVGGEGLVVAANGVLFGLNANVNSDAIDPITFGKGTSKDYFRLDATHFAKVRNLFTNAIRTYTANREDFIASLYTVTSKKHAGRIFIPLRVYNGARLDGVRIWYKVSGDVRTEIPINLPKARVAIVDRFGNFQTTVDPEIHNTGYEMFSPVASIAAWFDGGNLKAEYISVYAPIVGGAPQYHIVDTENFSYYLDFVDEYGHENLAGADTFTTTGTQIYGVTAEHSEIDIFDGRN